jgi:predicted TIM-barrel fold metal-dependent hydrolase
MVIDIHGHVSAPPELYAYQANLVAHRGAHGRGRLNISDESMEAALKKHLTRLKAAGIDLQLISPRPYTMMHSMAPARIVTFYIQACNDLIARQVKAHPGTFLGVCGLPQADGAGLEASVAELERCVRELGFVGCLLNPDPSEGQRVDVPPLGDPYWYPLYEKMVELDVPALIHSAGCCSIRHTYSTHFILEETVAILSLMESSVFRDFPRLKLVVSHGGGAVPYQMGRWMAGRYNRGGERFEESLRRLWFDTSLYTKDALELLIRSVGHDRVCFGTENPGTGTATHPDTGREMDDLRPVIESMQWLRPEQRQAIFEGNARSLYPLGERVAAARGGGPPGPGPGGGGGPPRGIGGPARVRRGHRCGAPFRVRTDGDGGAGFGGPQHAGPAAAYCECSGGSGSGRGGTGGSGSGGSGAGGTGTGGSGSADSGPGGSGPGGSGSGGSGSVVAHE